MPLDYELPVDSERCRFLCEQLNAAELQENATCSFDFFSGAFKFSDEVPEVLKRSEELQLPLVTLMRCLWGYRVSLVDGSPRADLLSYWNLTKELAPNWAGFAAERCSPKMRALADKARSHSSELWQDIEELKVSAGSRKDKVDTL